MRKLAAKADEARTNYENALERWRSQ
jgi:hypothetical protein